MASSNDNVSMALFCDFENVALGVRDANYEKFDIKPVLERLLLKGSIVVKKAYCDWDRYKGFKAAMHEANFELIEIPHVRQSGKNSADIRMVVDALDLCYTKSHVNTFVIISGDSDFSPLVSKLRENAKKVIGVGVKQSTSDLLVANCDEFIFYDDLVRESRRTAAKRDSREGQAVKRTPEEEKRRREEMDKRRNQAVEMAVETFDALVAERGDSGKIWASVLKEAIKRRKPDFSESYYGFRTFGNLLEEARARGFLEFGRDEKSGAYVYRSSGAPVPGTEVAADGVAPDASAVPVVQGEAADGAQGRHEGRGRGRGRGRDRDRRPFPNAGRVNDDVSSDLQLAQEENAYAQAEAEHAADDAVFAGHPDDTGQATDDAAQAAHVVEVVTHAEETVVAVDGAAGADTASQAQTADQSRRKQQKLPARAAKAAKMKAQQAAAHGGAAQAPAAQDVPAEAAASESSASASAPVPVAEVTAAVVADVAAESAARDAAEAADAKPAAKAEKGRGRAPAKGRGGKGTARTAKPDAAGQADASAPVASATPAASAASSAPAAPAAPAASSAPAARAPAQARAAAASPAAPAATAAQPQDAAAAPVETAEGAAKPARKPSTRGPRRPRKPDAKQGG